MADFLRNKSIRYYISSFIRNGIKQNSSQKFSILFHSYVISHTDSKILSVNGITHAPSTTFESVLTSISVTSVDSSSQDLSCDSKEWCWVAQRWSFNKNLAMKNSLYCVQTFLREFSGLIFLCLFLQSYLFTRYQAKRSGKNHDDLFLVRTSLSQDPSLPPLSSFVTKLVYLPPSLPQ